MHVRVTGITYNVGAGRRRRATRMSFETWSRLYD